MIVQERSGSVIKCLNAESDHGLHCLFTECSIKI